MTSKELKKIAHLYDINPQGLSKLELIRSIQLQEGNFDCFASATEGMCDQGVCRWRDDCLSEPQRA